MGGMHAGWFRIHKAHKVGAHLMLGFFRQAYTVHAGHIFATAGCVTRLNRSKRIL